MNKQRDLLAPMSGRLIPLQAVPDEVFAGGMLGEGFAVEPPEDAGAVTVCAPADGEVIQIAEAGHACTLHTPDGLEILVHIGIDTVSLGGAPFTALAAPGDRVRGGDALIEADLAAIRAAGLSPITPVIVTNPECLSALAMGAGEVRGGITAAGSYRVSEK